eukprot:4468200-Pyramimonas_sp.AAC.1
MGERRPTDPNWRLFPLQMLQERAPEGTTLNFVEDKLSTLEKVIKEPSLDRWNLFLGACCFGIDIPLVNIYTNDHIGRSKEVKGSSSNTNKATLTKVMSDRTATVSMILL